MRSPVEVGRRSGMPHDVRRAENKNPLTDQRVSEYLVVEFNTPPHAHPTENDLTSAPGRAWAYPLTPSCKFALPLAFPDSSPTMPADLASRGNST